MFQVSVFINKKLLLFTVKENNFMSPGSSKFRFFSQFCGFGRNTKQLKSFLVNLNSLLRGDLLPKELVGK